MRKSKLLILLTLALSFCSCSGSLTSLYSCDYPLTDETAKTDRIPIKVKVPAGWTCIEDNECGCIDLWLVNADYSASLKFFALNFDSLTMLSVNKGGIKSAAGISKSFKKAKYGKELKEFSNEELFEINGRKFVAYQYPDESKRIIRVVVFNSGGRYYECTAVEIKTASPPMLFNIQNSILTSIE